MALDNKDSLDVSEQATGKLPKIKKKRGKWSLILVFLAGLAILAYPIVSRIYYNVESTQAVNSFDEARSQIDQKEINQRLGLAMAYNDSLVTNSLEDPYTAEQEAGRAEYARMLEIHEQIGHIQIPKIATDIPMYAGTAESVLQKGVGHLEGTSLPVGGNSTHCVLTAHSGLPTARLFTDLNNLAVGDKFYIHNIGGTLAYQVDQVKTVEPTDFSDLLIVPGHDYVTLLTCTPYMINSHRLLVRGHQIDYVAQVDEKSIAENEAAFLYRNLFFATLAVLVVVLVYLLIRRILAKRTARQAGNSGGQDYPPRE